MKAKWTGRTNLLIRPGALGDALLTVPLVAQICLQFPGDKLVWYQSSWTCGLPWAKILPVEIQAGTRLSVGSFEDPNCARWLNLQADSPHPCPATDLTAGNSQLRSITVVTARPEDGLAAWCEKNAVAFRWVPAATGAVQEPPHAAERLCGHPIDLRHLWLRNKVPPEQRSSRLALLHPGAGSRAKRMSLMHWADLAKKLRAQGRRVRYLLGPTEREQEVWRTLNSLDDHAQMRPTPSLADMVTELRLATEFWGHDSGPAHLAGMLGLHTNVFFGPTNPDVWRPLGPKVIIHRFDSAKGQLPF